MKQASLMEYHVVASVTTISRTEETEPKLTAVTVKLEPATYGRCCRCERWTMLRFCLEYLDDEGDIVLWGDICEECAEALNEKLRERAPSKLASGDMLKHLRSTSPHKFVEEEFFDHAVKHGWTHAEAETLLSSLEREGVIFKISEGVWAWA